MLLPREEDENGARSGIRGQNPARDELLKDQQ
jgi:hypothetical protein